jgi:hypothetical protein
MKAIRVMLLAVVALLLAGNAIAQRTKAAPVPVFYDDAFEIGMPGDTPGAFRLDGLKTVRAAWITFAGYTGGKPARDPQVITLMEGTSTKWGAPEGGCTYEFKIANGAAPSISMTKVGFCTLREGDKALFRILAM